MTKTDVCNMALDFVGADPIYNVDNDDSHGAKRLRRLYPTAARKLLAAEQWQDAVETLILTYESNDDNYWNHKYEYIYDIPSDCLKALDIDLDDETDRFVEGSHLFSNIHEPSNEKMTVASMTETTIVCEEDIDSDVLSANKVRILIDTTAGTWKTYSYTSWSAKTFAGVTPDPRDDVTAGDALNAATNGMMFRYIKDIREESGGEVLYGEHIALAIARELAVMLAPSHEKGVDEIRMLEAFAEEALLDAKDEDNSGRYSVPPQEASWT